MPRCDLFQPAKERSDGNILNENPSSRLLLP